MRVSVLQYVFAVPLCLLVALPVSAADSGAPGAVTSDAPVTSIIPADGPVQLTFWGGFTATDNFRGGYTGAIVPLNDDLMFDGPLFRLDFLAGSYDSSSVAFGETEVDVVNGDLMLGYRTSLGSGWLSGYVGPAFQMNNNPDPTAAVRGSEWGVKGLIEYHTSLTETFGFSGFATYSSPFSTAFILGKLSLRISNSVWIGPEVSAFWIDSYSDRRIGAFIAHDTRFGGVGLSVGYVSPEDSDNDEGVYLNVNFGVGLH